MEIEPTIALDDLLDFDPERARKNIMHGYLDALKVLHETNEIEEDSLLTKSEYKNLVNPPIIKRVAK